MFINIDWIFKAPDASLGARIWDCSPEWTSLQCLSPSSTSRPQSLRRLASRWSPPSSSRSLRRPSSSRSPPSRRSTFCRLLGETLFRHWSPLLVLRWRCRLNGSVSPVSLGCLRAAGRWSGEPHTAILLNPCLWRRWGPSSWRRPGRCHLARRGSDLPRRHPFQHRMPRWGRVSSFLLTDHSVLSVQIRCVIASQTIRPGHLPSPSISSLTLLLYLGVQWSEGSVRLET